MPSLREQYAEVREQLLAIPEAAEAAGRKELLPDEQRRVAELLDKATSIADKIKQADESTALLDRISSLDGFRRAGEEATRKAAGEGATPPAA